MRKLFARNKKGFTLAELLIVVAIVAVLVAISIPVFTSKLEKAREATDVANMRAAKAEAVANYLGDDTKTGTFYYDAAKGELVDAAKAKSLDGYGKSTSSTVSITYGTDGVDKYSGNVAGEIIHIVVSDGTDSHDAGTITTMDWVKPSAIS